VRPKKEIVMTNKSTYYLVGFGCGSLAGLLFAPKAGAATRAGIVKAAKKRRRLVKEKIASTVAAMERCRIGTLRVLKRGLPSKRIRALFQ
jgi:gas vesicle protein